MNTKKALWVKRPKSYITIDLHSFSWKEEGDSSVYWTVGEEGEVSLTVTYDDTLSVDFVLLHTPSDYVRFTSKGIVSSFFGLNSFIPTHSFDSIVMKKTNETLAFYNNDELIYKIENPAFLGSASFGIETKGKGEVSIRVF